MVMKKIHKTLKKTLAYACFLRIRDDNILYTSISLTSVNIKRKQDNKPNQK